VGGDMRGPLVRRFLRPPRSLPSFALLLILAALIASALLLARPARLHSSVTATVDYTNFEGLQVHPLAITPDGTRLLALNTPDARLEIFRIGANTLTREGEIPVGLEPVSVAAENDSMAWVVNNVSDDVDIVSLTTKSVLATVRVGDEPTDVVFAGSPQRAFVCVSGEDAVKIYGLTDPTAPTLDITRAIFGRHPRALATGNGQVYVGVLDAGNRTTCVPADAVVAGGGPPPPNPPRKLQGAAPNVALIVQKVGPDWVDERPPSEKTWNNVITYDLPDQDVHVLDATTGDLVRTVTDVGTNLFNLAVAQSSGNLYVTNTEAFNRTRFEPNLRGRFLQNRLTRVAPGQWAPQDVWHLNSHIVYDTIPGPPSEKDLSLSQPIDLAINAAETKVYVAALGSDKVGVFDPAAGVVSNRIPTSFTPKATHNGPTGLALDEARGQLFVLNRFANSIAILSTATETCVAEMPLRFDPTPQTILDGRRFLYDGALSDHGDLACASCHIGSNLDNIAWDLGVPQGDSIPPFDPMKGPMVTQSLRGLLDTSPLHWRGDRADFTRFNPAFINLMGNADSLSSADMQTYSDFIMTVVYPPNPNQNLDRTWPDPAAPTGSPTRGKNEFENVPHDGNGQVCAGCHALPKGTNRTIVQSMFESQVFKVAQLRNIYQKTGFTRGGTGPQKRGFGVLHDGTVDNVVSVLHRPSFTFDSEQQRLDLEAFVLSFDTGMAPSVGRELTINASTKSLTSNTATLDSLYNEADRGNCDLVAHAFLDGVERGYVYVPSHTFESDYNPEGSIGADSLQTFPDQVGETITYLGVPPGSGMRMGIDRDRDGFRDRWEMALGSDPADPNSVPAVAAAETGSAPVAPQLFQNAPNPFNPSTTIAFRFGTAGRVRLLVFDVSGRLVKTLVDKTLPAGNHTVRWDGSDDRGHATASGRYYYRLRVGDKVLTRAMTLLR